jgi:hypothetical protein
MHQLNCNCPSCRAAAQGYSTELFEFGEFSSSGELSEQEELELAMELLSAENEQELEQFLGNLISKVGKGLKAVGSFAMKNVLPVLGPTLKQIAKTALPLAGGALGSLIPIPGVGTALGSALGGAVAKALELEVAGAGHADPDLVRARRFVRMAACAIREAAKAIGSAPPEVVARTALAKAVQRQIPAAAKAATIITQPSRPLTSNGGLTQRPVGAGSGMWRRHGDRIVVEGA